jgi:hypothetical protein
MATHTTTGGFNGRTFFIGRENGQKAKDGRPYFFEWIREMPTEKGNRKFETRTNAEGVERHYELFTALDGYLTNIEVEVKAFNGTQAGEKYLVIYMADVPESYKVEIARIDSRWATDLMKRLLDANFDPRQKLRISPFYSDTDGRVNYGISTFSGPDGKLTAAREDAHLQGIPGLETREWKGKIEYDWTAATEWLLQRIEKNVKPRLVNVNAGPTENSSPVNTNIRASEAANAFPTVDNPAIDSGFPEDNHSTESDDLPF